MPTLYEQMLDTLGVQPGLTLYIVETDAEKSEDERNSFALLASSLEEAIETFCANAEAIEWSWDEATIYTLGPNPNNPRVLNWHAKPTISLHALDVTP